MRWSVSYLPIVPDLRPLPSYMRPWDPRWKKRKAVPASFYEPYYINRTSLVIGAEAAMEDHILDIIKHHVPGFIGENELKQYAVILLLQLINGE